MGLMRITVLVSGRGSNLAALIAASRAPEFKGAVTHVVSSRAGVGALRMADDNAIATSIVDAAAFARRDAFDAAITAAVNASEPDLVVLAGFMRVLADDFVQRHATRLLNIHPSLLPAYPGLSTHKRALADGARVHGCTVHFVTPEVDVGPIVAQGAVPVRDGDDEDALAARVLGVEHILLPRVVRWYCEGRLVIDGRRVHVTNLETASDPPLLSPDE